MKRRTFLTATLCIVLVLYVTSVADARLLAPSIAYARPDVSVCKRFLETSDPGPYEMRTPYHWDIQIRVSTDVSLTGANVYDRFGGELKLDHITVPGGPTYTFTYPGYPANYITKDATVTISEGVGTVDLDKDGVTFGSGQYRFFIYWTGKTHKIHFQWIIGTIEPGEISIIIGVSTDYNPGGQPEFTSPCEHVLNSGAALHARCRGRRISAYSDRLCVKVECAARLLIDKFDDANGNGILDAGEPRIPGWQVYVTDPLGVVTTYSTPVDLEITEYGAYIITEEIRADWTQTALIVDGIPQTANPTVTVTVNIGETHEVLYGNKYCPPSGRLIIEKFEDVNGNGLYDAGDVMLTGWSIDITDPSGDVSTLTTSIDIPITEFGLYSITEDLPAGWTQTAVSVDDVAQAVNPTVTVTVNPGETHTVLYGNWQPPGSLEVKKFHDKNGNGVFDGDDEWITDWIIYLTDPSGDATTEYTPVGLTITEFGAYSITEDLPAGWEQTVVLVDGSPQTLDPTVTVTVNPSETHTVVYGNRQPGRLVIRKFNDKNNNGIFDGEDVWLTSWGIDVTDPSGDLTSYSALPIDLVITEFGTYTITEEIPAGWEQTAVFVDDVAQALDPTATVVVNPGETHEVVYGNYKPPPPPISITMTIDPIGTHPVGSTVTFSWSILTILPEIEPQQIELVLVRPNTTSFTLLTRTDFPAAYSGSQAWTAELPTGAWTLRIIYTYKYLGVTYTMGTFGTFNVVS